MPARSGRSRPRNAAVQFVLFYHSLVSDWNHGNAHFLRGIVRELRARGHEVALYEPADGWSRSNLLADHGERAIAEFEAAFPGVRSTTYDLPSLDLDRALEAADVVIVHEWNAPELVARHAPPLGVSATPHAGVRARCVRRHSGVR
jgi:spore maturation protein CgeB